jgi:hypothetical protein
VPVSGLAFKEVVISAAMVSFNESSLAATAAAVTASAAEVATPQARHNQSDSRRMTNRPNRSGNGHA